MIRKVSKILPTALILAFLSCTAAEDADRGGRGGRGADSPRRIVSLIPSATETIIALGAGDRLVARTEFDTDPALAHLPEVSGGLTPSLEHLMMLSPELVVAWPDNASRSVTARLGELGVEVYSPEIQDLADIYETTRGLGRTLGLETAADSLVAALQEELESLKRAVAGRERPSVFYVVWLDPPATAGPGTYIHELIEIAGGRNVFSDAPAMWPQVSLEEVVRRQPDIVILTKGEASSPDPERLRSAVGWRELRAVRAGRVTQVEANLFNRPGPRVAEAARRLSELFHPNAFDAAATPRAIP